MRSTLISLIIGLLVVAGVGFGGYYLIKKLSVSADVDSSVESADFNADQIVDGLDLNMLLKAVSNESENPKYDLNNDSKVDSLDADELTKQWNQ